MSRTYDIDFVLRLKDFASSGMAKMASASQGLRKSFMASRSAALALGGAVTAIGGYAVLRGFDSLVDRAAKFEAVMKRVGAVAGADQKTLERYQSTALRLAKDTPYNPAQTAEMMKILAQGGWAEKGQLEQFTALGLKIGVAGQLADLEDSARIINVLASGFGKDAPGIERALEGMSHAANATMLDWGDYATMFKSAAAASSTANQSFETTLAIAGKLTDVGYSAVEAGDKVAQFYRVLKVPSLRGTNILKKELGVDWQSIAYDGDKIRDAFDIIERMNKALGHLGGYERNRILARIFQVEGMEVFNRVVQNGVGNMRDFRQAITDADGELDKFMEANLTSWEGMKNQMSGAVDTGLTVLGQELLPLWKEYGGKVQEALNDTVAWTMANKESIGPMLRFGAQAAALVTGIGTLAAGIGVAKLAFLGLSAAFVSSPIGWVALGLTALGVGAVAVASNWDEITESVGGATKAFREFKFEESKWGQTEGAKAARGAWDEMAKEWEVFQNESEKVWDSFGEWGSRAWAKILEAAEPALRVLRPLADWIGREYANERATSGAGWTDSSRGMKRQQNALFAEMERRELAAQGVSPESVMSLPPVLTPEQEMASTPWSYQAPTWAEKAHGKIIQIQTVNVTATPGMGMDDLMSLVDSASPTN